MTTSVQDLLGRASKVSTLNGPLVNDIGEMISRVRSDQRELFTTVNSASRSLFQQTDQVTSTSGTANRTVNLQTALTKVVDRIEMVAFAASGAEVNSVDVMNVDAEYAPRYTASGLVLTEVGNDWQAVATAGPVTLKVTYLYGPVDLDPTQGPTQLITLADEWSDVLTLMLAAYLVNKDPGRADAEYARVQAMANAKAAAFLEYCEQYAGPTISAFQLPAASETGKK